MPPPAAEPPRQPSAVWSWIRAHPGVFASVLGGLGGLVGGAFTVGQTVGTLTAPTRVDTVEEEVAALRTQVQALAGNVDEVAALRTQVQALAGDVEDLRIETEPTAASNEVAALRTQVQALAGDVEDLRIETEPTAASNEVAALRTQVQALAGDVEDLRIETEPTAASNEVAALRTQVQALAAVASDEVDALRTQVDTLMATPQARETADVVNLRFLVGTLATTLASLIPSDEIEVLNTQVEILRGIMYCSIAQTEDVHQHIEETSPLGLTVLRSSRPSMEESCTELLGRLGVGVG